MDNDAPFVSAGFLSDVLIQHLSNDLQHGNGQPLKYRLQQLQRPGALLPGGGRGRAIVPQIAIPRLPTRV